MPDFHVTFRDLLHAVNLRHGTDSFTSPPKEGVLRIFSSWKIQRLRSGLNPRTWVPKASSLPLDHRRRYCHLDLSNSTGVFHILINDTIFWKKLNIECEFSFSLQILCETLFNLKRIQWDIIVNTNRSLLKYSSFLSDLNEARFFSTDFRKILKYQIFTKIRPVGPEMFHKDGQKNRRINMTTLIESLVAIIQKRLKSAPCSNGHFQPAVLPAAMDSSNMCTDSLPFIRVR